MLRRRLLTTSKWRRHSDATRRRALTCLPSQSQCEEKYVTEISAIAGQLSSVYAKELRPLLQSGHKALESFSMQLESYMSLLFLLQPRFPFPAMDGGAIAPDLALLLAAKILERRPGLTVELGSGVSTLVAGYMLQRNQHGRLISIEHDAHYLELARKSVRLHGLTDYVEVVHAPLAPCPDQEEERIWYDRSFIQGIPARSVDLLFVDGPPAVIEKTARYPALPALLHTLSPEAIVLVDDANRADEREILARWLREFPQLEVERLNTFKGTAALTFRSPDEARPGDAGRRP